MTSSRGTTDPDVPRSWAQDQALAARRILVIEDDEDSASILGELLECFGHEIRIARDGRGGIEAASEWRPEIVLCDIGLPDMDGYRVAREIRARRVPCRMIALTGYAAPEDARHAEAAGFDTHLAKPAHPVALLATIASPAMADQRRAR